MDEPVLPVIRVGRFRAITHLLDGCHNLAPHATGRRRVAAGHATLSGLADERLCWACGEKVADLARHWRDLPADDRTWLVATARRFNGSPVSWHVTVYGLLDAWPHQDVDHPIFYRQRLYRVPGRLGRAIELLSDNQYEAAGPLDDVDDTSFVAALFADGELGLQSCVKVVATTRS